MLRLLLSSRAVISCRELAATQSQAYTRLRCIGLQHQCSYKTLPQGLKAELDAALGGRVSTAPSLLEAHGRDESYHPIRPPDVVVFPHTTEEVAQVVKACAKAQMPVIPFGTGTSLDGQIAAVRGGVCLDLSQMTRVVGVNSADMDCRVEAGVTRKALNEHLRDTGLFFPVDPGADASLGGMASTRASGTNAVRYGTMRENVLGMTVVMGDGSIVELGRRVRKSSAGYDLTHLMVGSEGTLGVITELALRLHPRPEATTAAVCEFQTMRGAVDAVVQIMQQGIPVARMELLDEFSLHAVNAYSGTSLAAVPTLFFEFHGSAAGVEENAVAVGEIVSEHGGAAFKWAREESERNKLWEARHTAYYAALAVKKGCKGFPTDVCVPISHLTECILESQRLCARARIFAPLVGHVGDGNFHMMMVIDPDDEDEVDRAEECVRDMVLFAQSLGGTCTGEHGVGYGKLEHLKAEWHGEAPLHMMAAIKKALDPLNIMNPGKLGSDPATFLGCAERHYN